MRALFLGLALFKLANGFESASEDAISDHDWPDAAIPHYDPDLDFLQISNDSPFDFESTELLHDLSRKLQAPADPDDIPCNVPYAEYTKEAIIQTLTQIFTFKATNQSADNATVIINDIIPKVKYDVQLMKVCASCRSEKIRGYGCMRDDYGNYRRHSGLVMLPVKIDEETSKVSLIPASKLRPFAFFRGVTVAPVDSFNVIFGPGFDVWEYALLAAGLGYVSMAPEQSGYGSGAGLVPSPVDKKSIVTAALPIYSYAKKYVHRISKGKTGFTKDMSFMGWSTGGFHAISAADGFKKHGIETAKVLATSTPIKVRSWTPMGFFRSLQQGNFTSDAAKAFGFLNLALSTLSYSDTRPGVENNGSGQTVLNPALVASLLEMFTDLTLPSAFKHPNEWFTAAQTKYPANFNFPAYFTPNVMAFYYGALATNEQDPCKNTPQGAVTLQVDQLCKALDANDLTNLPLNKYNIDSCHSKSDALIVFENTVASILKYTIEGFSHAAATFVCDAKLFANFDIKQPIFGGGSKAGKGKGGSGNGKKPKMGKSKTAK